MMFAPFFLFSGISFVHISVSVCPMFFFFGFCVPFFLFKCAFCFLVSFFISICFVFLIILLKHFYYIFCVFCLVFLVSFILFVFIYIFAHFLFLCIFFIPLPSSLFSQHIMCLFCTVFIIFGPFLSPRVIFFFSGSLCPLCLFYMR